MDDMEEEWWMIWRGSGGYGGGVVENMEGEWWKILRESGG